MEKLVSIVIPVFNESGNLMPMLNKLQDIFSDCYRYRYEVIFVDDDSTDDTMEQLRSMSVQEKRVFYISFSRNFGHQNALKAGLDRATGDCVITLDGDLQHPPSLIPEMLAIWEQGFDIVYTRRRADKRISPLKRVTSAWYGRILKYLSGMPIEQGVADFKLLDRKVINALTDFHETDIFLRGVIYWIGFRKTAIDYSPEPRFSGQTKYSTGKMLQLAIQGITSFSIKPLYVSVFLGALFIIVSLLYAVYAIWHALSGQVVAGWASTIISIVFMGGINLFMLGITGIYISKIFIQTKYRPAYIIRETNYNSKIKENQV
jgi:dolichol-phosphate mannosyltransferase